MQYNSLKKAPTQERGRKRVADILDACEHLVGDMNYQDVSIHDIARQAGVSTGTVYHFFGDKDAIFICLIERTVSEVLEEFERSLDAAMTLRGALQVLVANLRVLWQQHSNMHVLYRQFQPRPDLVDMLSSTRSRAIELMKQQVLASTGLEDRRAYRVARNLYLNTVALMDDCADLPESEVPGFMEEWWVMIEAYVDSITGARGKAE